MKNEEKWREEYSKKCLKQYISLCIQLNWQMAIQSPPIHILFEPVSKKSLKFDKDKYHTYTKAGNDIDYVVWPPVLLYEGGELLSKGVAQGK